MDIQLTETGSQESDAFIKSHPEGTLYHLSGIQQLISRTFAHKPLYLTARNNGSIAGVLPLVHMRSRLFGKFFISVPFFNYGGVCASSEDARAALLEEAIRLARQESVAHIELRHTATRYPQLQSKHHKVAMILPLPETAEALWQQFKSKLRSQIRRPEKEGLSVRAGKAELLDDFYRVFAANMRDLGTPVYTRKLFSNMLHTFPDACWIVAVYRQEACVAAGFLVGFRETMEIPWASSLRAYNRLAGNMLMYWHALKLAINEGYRHFDFGRSTPGEGTYKFKAQWGAEPLPLHWEYWLPNGGALPDISPKNSKFQLAVQLWQKLPLPLTRIIGPGIVRNIP